MVATKSIDLRTEIPGPRSREILEREESAVARPLRAHPPLVVASASGSTIVDVDGNTLLDFVGGVGVLNVGHNHPRVVRAIHEQADRFLHTDYTVVPYEVYVEVAERLGARSSPSAGRPARRSSTRARRPSRTRSSSRACGPAARP
jgi:4-aminobutyrate aminotransferase/(S)-3-amino-2-methylpropionate transaminase